MVVGNKRQAASAAQDTSRPSASKRRFNANQASVRHVKKHPSVDDESPAAAGQIVDPMIDPQQSDGSSESSKGGSPEVDDHEDEVDASVDGDSVDEGEDGHDEQSQAGPSTHAANSRGKSKFRPPTLEELDELRQAERTGGTTFSLQLEALLASTLLPQTPQDGLKKLLSSVHSHIMALPSLESLAARKAVKRLGVSLSFPGPDEFNPLKRSDVQWTLGWEKPEEVLIGGSWSVCGGYRKGKKQMGDINMVVVMPPTMFSTKDRMDYRYLHKRAHYLTVIEKSLEVLSRDEKSPLYNCDIRIESDHGDTRRSEVVISAGKDHGLRYAVEIRIAAAVPDSTFPASSLAPSKSLLRHSSIPPDSPTPLYSTSILHDTLHKAHLLHLHRLSHSCTMDRMVDSFLALWRIWSFKRGICRNRGGSGWFASMLLGWVVEGAFVGGVGGDRSRTNKASGVGKSLDAWAALKAAWERLATADFAHRPVSLCVSREPAIPFSQLLEANPLLLIDPNGAINIFASWSQGDVDILQNQAWETLALLEDTASDHFSDIFLKDSTMSPIVFDDVFMVDTTSVADDPTLLDRSERPSRIERVSVAVEQLLRRGLTDRVRVIHCSSGGDSPECLCVGLMYDPSNATRVLDVGPASGAEAESRAFRDLWGDKAELRRFKDGSIAESVVWSIARPEDAALIPSEIVSFLLEKHLDIRPDQIIPFASDRNWLEIIQTPTSARDAINVAGSEKLGFRPVLDGYEELYKTIRLVDSELPLSILQIQPASELLRYSTPFVPHPIDTARYATAPDCLKHVPRAEVVLQFESSPRWPDDLAAIQKVKLALMQKLAELLMGAQRDTKAGIVFDPGATDIEDSAGLEVLLPSGVAFVLRIYHERERMLLQRVIDDDQPAFGTALPFPPHRLAVPALAKHTRRFVHLPKHHSAIAPLHHRFPSYSSAVRLFKRWFAAHMLSLRVEVEAVELIMANVYLQPGTLHSPASAPAGFTRAIKLLAEWDWKTEPLVVPLAAEVGATVRARMDTTIRSRITQGFEERRKKDSLFVHSAWVIGTEQDPSGLRWTGGITKVVANRVKSLAKATMEQILTNSDSGDLSVQSLFTTSTKDYDVRIHLHTELLTTYSQAVQADRVEWESKRFKNVQKTVYGEEIRVAFDPALALAQDIQRLYGDALLVFFDQHGGQVIGLLWNPDKSQARALKPFLGHSTRPASSEAALVTLSKEAIISEIRRLGHGLIKDVVMK